MNAILKKLGLQDQNPGSYLPFEFEPVSQVSIDEDWSAMRFRHVDNIKIMKRKTAATEKGKERIKEDVLKKVD